MQFYPQTINARFLKRVNRFQAICELEGEKAGEKAGEEVWAYVANPGRLMELLHPGVSVKLAINQSKTAKMPYQMVGVESRGHLIPLNTHLANKIVEDFINAKKIPALQNYHVKKREATLGDSRFDFLLEDAQGQEMYLEVKTCTLFSKQVAQFPDAVTARGKKHLDGLIEISKGGVKAGVLILVCQQQTPYFLPDFHTDLSFAESFLAAKDHLDFFPLGISFDPTDFSLSPQVIELTIPWNLLQKQAKDAGVYLYSMLLEKEMSISIGKIGVVDFQAGYYIYAGSAKKNLHKRLARHQRQKKKNRWHIDYLRQEAKHHAALAIATQLDLECNLASAIEKLADAAIKNFGCSDCSCNSHLFYFKNDPLNLPEFHQILQYFRIDHFFEDSPEF